MAGGSEEPIIIGLAIAVVIGIGSYVSETN